MAIQLSAELETLVCREISSGRFSSIEEIIRTGVQAREEHTAHVQSTRHQAVAERLDFARNRAVPLQGVTIREADRGRPT